MAAPSLLDALPPSRYTLLPNTTGCYSADDAVRTLRMARELLDGHTLVWMPDTRDLIRYGGNERYPAFFQPYGGFPDGVRVQDGHVTLPELPGIGFEGKADLYARRQALAARRRFRTAGGEPAGHLCLEACHSVPGVRGLARATASRS